MIFKRMLKFSLCAAMLGATSTAFADKEVKLGDSKGTVVDWTTFVATVNAGIGSDVTTKQTAYDKAVADLAALKEELNNLPEKYSETVVDWLQTDLTNAREFQAKYNAYIANPDIADADKRGNIEAGKYEVYAYITYSGLTKKPIINISFTPTENLPEGTTADVPSGYVKTSVATILSKIYNFEGEGTPIAPANVNIYLGKKYENGATLPVTYSTDIDNFANVIVSAINALTTDKKYITTDYSQSYKDKQAEITAQQTVVDNALTALNAAKSAVADYEYVTLTQSFTATEAITGTFTGTIDGAGYVITLNGATTLFGKPFTGSLIDVAVTGGKISSTTTGAHLQNVAVWNGSNSGTFYNANGEASTYTSVNELGFAARDYFGVENGVITKLSPANKLYKITTYSPTSTSEKYLNEAGVKALNLVNTFAKSETTDVASMNLTNVFYGTNNTCAKVVITDKVLDENKKPITQFYAPVDINATEVVYERTLAKDDNTIILPFDVNPMDYSEDMLCTFEDFAANKFWFTQRSTTIAANTPMLWKTKAGQTLENFGTKTIKATPASMIVKGDEGKTAGNFSFGTYKKALPGEINGESAIANVWALQGREFRSVSVSSTTVNIPAFRTVIYSPVTAAAPAMAPRQFVIVDEDGVEVAEGGSSAVENVAVETGISIVAGQGEIAFTSEANYGKVEVYNLDGGVAAVVDVTAGTTYVDLAKGVYVVMGKKVLVK